MTESVSNEFSDLVEALNSHKGDVVLYGAGAYGEKTYGILTSAGYKITAFCDASPAKVGTVYMTKPVISIEQLAQISDYIVIIAVLQKHHDTICESLIKMGVKNIYAVSLPQLKISQLMSIMPADQLIMDIDEVQMSKHAYQKLCDSTSKENFVAWLYYSLSGEKSAFDGLTEQTNIVNVPAKSPDLANKICEFGEPGTGGVSLLYTGADNYSIWRPAE